MAVKSEQQQAVLSLHRIRAQWVKIRTLQANQMRGLLYEFGVVVPLGWRALLNADRSRLTDGRGARYELLRQRTARATRGLRAATDTHRCAREADRSWQRAEPECRRIAAIPGVGPLTPARSSPASRMRGQFRSARQFAAYLGLVPRQSGTGGRVKLLGISKRGDPYLRTLLIHGARSVLLQSQSARRDRTTRGSRSCSSGDPATSWWWHWRTRWLGRSGRCWRTVGRLMRDGVGAATLCDSTGGTAQRLSG